MIYGTTKGTITKQKVKIKPDVYDTDDNNEINEALLTYNKAPVGEKNETLTTFLCPLKASYFIINDVKGKEISTMVSTYICI